MYVYRTIPIYQIYFWLSLTYSILRIRAIFTFVIILGNVSVLRANIMNWLCRDIIGNTGHTNLYWYDLEIRGRSHFCERIPCYLCNPKRLTVFITGSLKGVFSNVDLAVAKPSVSVRYTKPRIQPSVCRAVIG